jgi:hypothetical protein
LDVQVLVLHLVVCGAQSAAALQATHEPLPLHTVPLLSLHAVPKLALDAPQVFDAQVLVLHLVVCGVQSAAALQATHEPLPLHTWPPLSEQAAPWLALANEHALDVHEGLVLHAVAETQSPGALHCTQPFTASHTWALVEQSCVAPALQVLLATAHVLALVKTLPLHEEGAQFASLVHCTQPLLATQAGLGAEQVVVETTLHVLFDTVHVLAGLNTLPLQEAVAQSPLPLHCTQAPLALHTWPPLSLHVVPAVTGVVAHVCDDVLHATVWHLVAGGAQSAVVVHPQKPPLQVWFEPHGELSGLLDHTVGVAALQTWQALLGLAAPFG